MLSFASDYVEGAHPAILQALIDTNMEKLPGYGDDRYTASAKAKIKAACGMPDADVWLLTGGTQTNQIVISTMLASYEGVLSAVSGHVNGHEAGAIEYTGHKVMPLPAHEGKVDAAELADYLHLYFTDGNREHMVRPGMLYISHPTEYGTLYTLSELTALSEVCRSYSIPLFMDGARLGYGLATPSTDVTLQDIARLCDVFYIGGTKVGALCGEAVVFTHKNTPPHFLSQIKQHGALLAKGRLLGVQFDTLFTDDLYFKISSHAMQMADLMRSIFAAKGCEFFIDSPTNQIFITLEDTFAAKLAESCTLAFWEKPDPTHTVYRFATSWATREEDVRALGELL